jgi:hypothetical protein
MDSENLSSRERFVRLQILFLSLIVHSRQRLTL